MEKISLTLFAPHNEPTEVGGVANYCNLFYKYLDRNQFNLNLVKLGRKFSYKRKNKAGIIHMLLRPVEYLFFLILDTFNLMLNSKIKNSNVVHFNTSLIILPLIRDLLFAKIARLHGSKTVLFIRGWNNDQYDFILSNSFLRSLISILIQKIDTTIVLGEKFKDKITNLGYKGPFLVTTTVSECSKFNIENKIFNEKIKLLFCSRIEENKGIFDVLNAMKALTKINSNIELNILGTGLEEHNMLRMIQDNSLNDCVFVHGFTTGKKKYNYFNRSHIFIFPSRHYEGFPNSLCEAMSAGLALITSPSGGFREVFQDKVNGRLLKTDNFCEEIEKYVSHYIHNIDKLKHISKINRFKAISLFDIKSHLTNVEKVYNSLATDTYKLKV